MQHRQLKIHYLIQKYILLNYVFLPTGINSPHQQKIHRVSVKKTIFVNNKLKIKNKN